MSRPYEPGRVKLISSLFSPEEETIAEAIEQLCETYGPVDWISPELFFDRTKYYAGEMGWPLYRRFISFSELVSADSLVDTKLRTNQVEQQYLLNGNRRVNIDPGFISLERLILATGKNYVHRVYLSKGIYADLTLIFQNASYRPLEWTFKDYADKKTIGFFNEIRNRYMSQLREDSSALSSRHAPP
ncbi:MAG: DUF4416 family protein [Thermodesulfobacteriota bacterium]|nr:DUF4416 family protein [Thermodesulfobacteriota bacterium]